MPRIFTKFLPTGKGRATLLSKRVRLYDSSVSDSRMKISKTLTVATRAEWRRWLKHNYQTEKEIWLVYQRAHTGKARLSYNDAVEEALCFGWIDSNVKSLDDQRVAQKFSPRRPRSRYSQTNKERLSRLVKAHKVPKTVLAELGNIDPGRFKTPPDILQALKSNRQAWRNFQKYSPSYRRIRIAFVDGARKRPAEFQKRLRYLLRMTEQDKQFGYGIEKFY